MPRHLTPRAPQLCPRRQRPGAVRARSGLPGCGRGLGALLGALLACSAQADPGYYLIEPYDRAGMTTVETRYWEVSRPGRPAMAWPEVGVSRGVNSRWTTGVYWSWIGPQRGPYTLSSFNWTNELLLTQGNWPLDVALHTQWVRDPADHGGGTLEAGTLLQTDFGRTRANLNLLWERGLGNDSVQPTQLKLQWQLRHRWTQGLHLGLQGFSELGPWNDWASHSRQSHRAGPAVFGQLGQAAEGQVALSAAWLQGRTYGRSGHMLTLRAAVSF